MRCTHGTSAIAVAGVSTTKTNTLKSARTNMRAERAGMLAYPKTGIPEIGIAKRIAAGAGFLR